MPLNAAAFAAEKVVESALENQACFRFTGITVPRFFRAAAAPRACLASASGEAACRLSRWSAPSTARERFAAGFFPACPLFALAKSRSACLRVRSDVRPGLGGGRSTPARRALERAMAIAWLGDRAACLPFRI